jgi:hypothetical protein
VIGPDGALATLSAYGVLFQDRELIWPAIVDVEYRRVAVPAVAPPPDDLVRP